MLGRPQTSFFGALLFVATIFVRGKPVQLAALLTIPIPKHQAGKYYLSLLAREENL